MAKIGTQMVCANCEEVFCYQSTCPVCGSTDIYPLGRWFAYVTQTQGKTIAEKLSRPSDPADGKEQICSFFGV